MNVANEKAKLLKVLDCLPAGSVTPADVVVQDRPQPIILCRVRQPGFKLVPTVCVWGPEQDREVDKPRKLYAPYLTAQPSTKNRAAAQAKCERRAKLVREWIAEYNDNGRPSA